MTGQSAAQREMKHETSSIGDSKTGAFQDFPSSLSMALEVTEPFKARPDEGNKSRRANLKQETRETGAAKEPDMEHASRLDVTASKRILRFLLPMVGQKLGSSTLVSLLCLDRVSAELDLGLNFESLWETELTSINILIFVIDCLAAARDTHHKNLTVDHSKVEDLVVRAMDHIDSRKALELLPTTGRDRLSEIVRTALESGHALEWVSVYGEDILRVLASGPSQALLEHCQGKEDTRRLQQTWNQTRIDTGVHGVKDDMVLIPKITYCTHSRIL